MARSSRLSVCLAIAMRNSSKIHCARSISRQRTTPWTAGIGPLSIMRAMAWRWTSLSLDGCPGDFPFSNAIYEEDFLGVSYGFRAGRGPHDALDALVVGISSTKVNWILDADIRSFFDEVSQEWLVAPDRRSTHDPPDSEMAPGGHP